MNATLTALAAALALALAAALIGPHFVDWTAYRAEFEARASQIAGAPVRVRGDVDARLLPNPSIRFHDVVIGAPGETARLEAREFALRLSPAPLLKGDVHVRDVEIGEPLLSLEIGPDGEVALPLDRRGVPGGLDPARVMLDRVIVRGGRIVLHDPEHGRVTEVGGIEGTGSAGSLTGPFRFDGAALVAGESYRLRFGMGRVDGEGKTPLKLEALAQESGRGLTLDGVLSGAALRPRYAGRVIFTSGGGDAWRVAGTAVADLRAVALDDLSLTYGPDERALRLDGFGEAVLGATPRARLTLTARQLDVDRLLGPAETPRPPGAALGLLAERWAGLAGLPLSLELKVDGVMIGGELAQNVMLAAVVDEGALSIEAARADLPGAARAAVAGKLSLDEPRFAGRIEARTDDAPQLMRWLGAGDTGRGARRMELSAALDVSARRVEAREASLSVDGEKASGTLVWTLPENGPAALAATIAAQKLDLDALNLSALPDLLGGGEGKPPAVILALEAGELRYLGLSARDVALDLAAQPGDITVRRLRLGELGGATLAAEGDLRIAGGEVSGRLTGRIEARSLRALARLAEGLVLPAAATQAFSRRAEALAPLSATLVLGAADGPGITFRAEGEAGGSRLALRVDADRLATDATVDAEASLDADNADRLLAQLGFEVIALGGEGGGRAALTARGRLDRGLDTAVALTLPDAALTARGTLRAQGGTLEGALDGQFRSDDLTPLLARLGRLPPALLDPVPARIDVRAVVSPGRLEFKDIDGEIAGRTVAGELALSGLDRMTVGGALAFDRLDLGDVVALAAGPLALGEWSGAWPSGPVSAGVFDGFSGTVALKAEHMTLPGLPPLRGLTGKVRLAPGTLSLADAQGETAGGGLGGDLTVQTGTAGVTLRTRLSAGGVSLAEVLGATNAGDAVAGTADLTADLTGSGSTIAAAVANLSGGGALTARDVTLAGIDPAAVQGVREAAVMGLPLNDAAIAAALGQAMGDRRLAIREASGAFTVAGGVARLPRLAVAADEALIAATGVLDITRGTLEAVLEAAPRAMPDVSPEAVPRVSVLVSGPLAAPRRSLGVTALTGFLTAEAIERETERIRQLEAEGRERARQRREEEAAAQQRREEQARRAAQRRAEEERLAREMSVPPLPPPQVVAPPPGAAPFRVTPPDPAAPLVISPRVQQP